MRPAKYHVECRVGRLIETRLEWLNTAGEVALVWASLTEAFKQAGPGAVACSDWRKVEVLPPEVGEAVVELLRRGNDRLERSAMLLSSGNAVFNLQVDRLLREAGNPARRAFRDVEQLLAWVGEVLRPEELARARAWFA